MKILPSIEPLLRRWRIWVLNKDVIGGDVGLDIGCDEPPLLIQYFQKRYNKWIGLDSVASPRSFDNVEIINQILDKRIKMQDDTFDLITMTAVLEHLQHPMDIIKECHRLLKNNGRLLITVPSPKSKPVLELFATIGLVREEMIHQHENYFTKQQLEDIFINSGFKKFSVRYFQLGFNTYAKAEKTK